MMDACINYQGDLLYYTNAFFGPTYTGCSGVPCIGRLGIAQKINDSTFNKLATSETLLQSLNDTNYVVYAPCISKDGLELYYTRFQKNNIPQGTQICVAVRSTSTAAFTATGVIHPFSTQAPEAVTQASDQSKIYYHKKINGVYTMVLRFRTSTVSVNEERKLQTFSCFPNPFINTLEISAPLNTVDYVAQLSTLYGQEVVSCKNCKSISAAQLSPGLYVLRIRQEGENYIQKVIKQ